MTILRFITIGGKDYIGWNDEPVIQQKMGGCRSLYQTLELYGGGMFSDEKIPGWHPAKMGSGHIYGAVEGFGDVISGVLYPPQAQAAGFNMESPNLCWRSGNASWKLTKKQFDKYYRISSIEKRKEFLDGLFPSESEPLLKPAPRKREGNKVRGPVIIPF